MLAIFEAWRVTPPVAELVAGFVGYKPPPKPMTAEELRNTAPPGHLTIAELERSANDPSGIGGLIARFPNGFVTANR